MHSDKGGLHLVFGITIEATLDVTDHALYPILLEFMQETMRGHNVPKMVQSVMQLDGGQSRPVIGLQYIWHSCKRFLWVVMYCWKIEHRQELERSG